jgi:hypothetical protein
MPISSNRRQRVIEFATPKVADLVVVERIDCSKSVNAAATAEATAYGTAHPDTTRFPNFNLALIKNGDNEQGQFQDWYYVKDRANQDDYNWEFQAAGASTPRFDTVVRTYVTPREDYLTNSPSVGFNTVASTNDLLQLGQKQNFTTVMPSGDTAITPFDGAYLTDGYYTSSPIKFDSSYIFFERKQVRSGDETLDTLYVIEQRTYVKRVTVRSVDADKQFSYSIFNEASPAQAWGGLVSKETLFHKTEFVKATIDFTDSAAGTAGVSNTLYAVNENDARKAEYVFSDNDATYTGVGGEYSGDLAFWGVDDFGVMREGKQLSDSWYALSEREVIRKDTNGLVADYFTNQTVGWPAVFSHMFATVWNRKDGGKHTNVHPVYAREAYSGPTKVRIQISWQKASFSEPATEAGDVDELCLLKPMEAMAMEFVTPNWRVKTKPCLHGDVTVTYTNGTEDPVWDYGGYKMTWAATNYVDWCHPYGEPSGGTTIIIADSQEAFRGGYLRTKVTAYKPNITTTGDRLIKAEGNLVAPSL